MNLEGRRVLVTGAGGFIGSHLVERLVELGATVRAMVRYNSRNDRGMIERLPAEVVDQVTVVVGDLAEEATALEVVKGMEVVFHLGALIAIPFSYLRPHETVRANVLGTLNVMQAARAHGTKKVVHTSTSEVYGSARYTPIDEKHPLQGQSPYAASKIGADKIAESFHLSFGLPVATIRPFNTYGPRQSARAVIPAIVSQALVRDTVELGSLHPTRDLTYVTDTVDGFVKVAESDRSVGEVINVGSNFQISIGELAEQIVALVGRDVKIRTTRERERPERSEVQCLQADNRRAAELLGWRPAVTFREGLQRVIDWVRNHPADYKADCYNV